MSDETVIVNIRISADEKRRLQEAAALNGETFSSFLRSAAILAARRVLAEFEPHIVRLSSADSAREP